MNQNRTRPESKRPKMPRAQRAKQFAPFDALTGLGGKLKQAEEEHRRELEAGARGSALPAAKLRMKR